VVKLERIALAIVVPDPTPEAREAFDKDIEAIAHADRQKISKLTAIRHEFSMSPRPILRAATISKPSR